MKRNVRLQLWCWVALWVALIALAVSVWLLSERIEEFERRFVEPRVINTEDKK